jgi:hypothetical protein
MQQDNQNEQGGVRVGDDADQNVSLSDDLDLGGGGDINVGTNEPPIIIQGGGVQGGGEGGSSGGDMP